MVVSSAPESAGYVDQVQELRRGSLRPIQGLGPIHAFAPDVDEDGTVLYLELDRTAQPPRFQLREWRSDEISRTRFSTENPLTAPAVASGQTVVVIEKRLPANVLHVLSPSGDDSAIEAPIADAIVVHANRRGLLALSNQPNEEALQRTTVITEDGEVVTKIDGGWAALAWSPDGEDLLLRKGHAIGVAFRQNSWDPIEIGRSSQGEWLDAVWIEA